MRRARHIVIGHEDRIAIRRAFGGGLDADSSAGAHLVLDQELLADGTRQVIGGQTSDEIQSATRRERHDEPYRPRRVGLRPCEPRYSRQRGSARGQMQELAAGKLQHDGALPERFCAGRLAVRRTSRERPYLSVTSPAPFPSKFLL